MDDKIFGLLEKMYSEFISFKDEVNGKFNEVNGKFDEVNGKFDEVNGKFDEVNGKFDRMDERLRKIELGQEELKDKVSEAFEAIDTLSESNNRQHEEIMKKLKDDIGVVELAVRRIAK